jgi:hypothetical protein
MIGYLNNVMIDSLKRYNISFIVVRPFFLLNSLLHKLFYKYLLRKYSSLPKIYSYIRTYFRNQGSAKAKNKCLFKVINANFLNSADSYSIQNSNDKKHF